MVHKLSSVTEAYTVLGLEQGTSLEIVKSTYKQLALKTHPDKNPGDEDATAQFQRLSEAYNVLLKHLDRSSSPPLRHAHPHSHTHTHSHFHPFGEYEYDDYDDYDEYDDFYDDEFDDYDSDYDDHLDFYRFLFEELLRGRASAHAHSRYHRFHKEQADPETPEQYSARLRKAREEQEQAAERRARDEANRKANQEKQREKERREAEERQRLKAFAKKAEAEAARKAAEQKARAQQEKLQATRSKVFAAARRGDAAAVRKGVWEENVDAAGGELRPGAAAFVKSPPADPKETLLHIAARNGDLALVQWLDAHSAEPEERDGSDLTAFHVALANKHAAVVRHFFETYAPEDGDYAAVYRAPAGRSNVRIALETREPEMVWMVLEKRLCTEEEMDDAWAELTGAGFARDAKWDEFVNLFTTYGDYERPAASSADQQTQTNRGGQQGKQKQQQQPQQNGKQPRQQRPTVTVEDARSAASSPVSETPATPSSASPSSAGPRPSRGRGNRGRPYQPRPQHHNQQSSQPSSPTVEQPAPQSPASQSGEQQHQQQQQFNGHRGRGRGRGRGMYRGRGRGRGQPPTGGQPTSIA
ncbi:hypothetical protein OH77DRAFT_1584536 [Trametes cingulata]|nr:hypothetical protein OH77DRAFT_1584536 [Trametes cingulata]